MQRYSTEGLEKIRLANEARFVRNARAKFGDRFDYSHIHYSRQKAPVTIVCPDHGEFTQTPDKHLQSSFGCPKCGVDARALARIQQGRHRFLLSFLEKYGDRLELLSEYVSAKSPIQFRCKIHGLEFESTPDRLNVGIHGCSKCARESIGEQSRLSQDDFIRRVVAKFGDQFDLSMTDYLHMQESVTVGCPIHGEFQATPANFLNSTHGCPKCGRLYAGYAQNRIHNLEQRLTKSKPTTIALMKVEVFGIRSYKLGTTSRGLLNRYREYLKEILFESTLDELDALRLEQHLHAKYFKSRDLRIFLAGMRAGKRWAGDSELYKEDCVTPMLDELKATVRALEKEDKEYWHRQPKLMAPILRIRTIDRPKGTFKQPKPVVRLDTLEKFPTVTEAAKSIGSTQGLVSLVCKGKRGSTKGVKFAYVSDYEAGLLPNFVSHHGCKHPAARSVKCTETGKVYKTISDAAKDLGINGSKITAVCRGHRKRAGGYRWEYADFEPI